MTDNAAPAERPHHEGHRQRLRARFLAAGGAAMPDYELLELVLCLARPRGDVKPLAKALIARFGSFAGVISASPEALATVKGVGDTTIAALKTVQAGAERLTREEAMEHPVLGSWEKVLRYCRAAMAHEKIEQFRVLFLDNRNRLIADEIQQTGTINHTPLYPREVVRRGLEHHAAALILVHNHPSGDPEPSKADIDMTRQVVRAAEAVGLRVHDHLIITRAGHTSLRGAGLM